MSKRRFLVNPSSGGGKARRRLADLRAMAAKWDAELVVSRDVRHLREESFRAAEEGLERLIVAGGDGTFHHAVQGLAQSECAMGLVPLGRGNDQAMGVGAPSKLEEAVDFACEGPVRTVDLGRCGERWFLGYCGAGFDSEVADFAHKKGKILRGRLGYLTGVVVTLMRYRAPRFVVWLDNSTYSGEAMFVVACNCPSFGGGMQIAPDAEINDGMFDLVVVDKTSRLELLKVFPRVFKGEHVDHPGVTIIRSRRVTLKPSRLISVSSDGEPMPEVGEEGLNLELVPGALRVVSEA